MSFELSELLGISLVYLALLFAVAYISERGWLPEKVIRHPLVYILSVGVYAGAFAFFGAVELAYQYGYGYLTYYFGASTIFLFAPLLLLPLMRICTVYQLGSLADLFSFRYRSQWAGTLVTIGMLLAIMPLLAMQIQAVTESIYILTDADLSLLGETSQAEKLALIFCLMILLFTLLFGARHAKQQRNNGLVVAIAFETLLKTIILMVLGFVSIYAVFGGFMGLDKWLQDNQQFPAMMVSRLQEGSFRTLLLVFFSAGIALPHMFHMTFAESPSRKNVILASWGVPLLLLCLSLPILPILWAGIELGSGVAPEYFNLKMGLNINLPCLSLLAYVGGLSAASGTIIVITLALASMCLNHLVMPFYQPSTQRDIYRWILWTKRLLILGIIIAGYLSYRFLRYHDNLAGLGFAAFTATLQFLPGVLALLYWPGANRNGLISGLITGFGLWALLLLLPALGTSPLSYIPVVSTIIPPSSDQYWMLATLLALGANMVTFGLVSFLTMTSLEEQTTAELCSQDDLDRPIRETLNVKSVDTIVQRLSKTLGMKTAQREVERSLKELNLTMQEQRPYALRRLRDKLEANLSGLLGPSVAHELISRELVYLPANKGEKQEDIHLIEHRLDSFHTNLTGLAAQLDSLRRYHRYTLQQLPIGVCALGSDHELLMWNCAMEKLTGISSDAIIGSYVETIPPPWNDLLASFANKEIESQHKKSIETGTEKRWISLHKASDKTDQANQGNQVIVVEDLTENQLLEQELIHNERLASIGRLAAGVAHEIGNPITGIDCLAQNLRYDSDDPLIHETAQDILTQTKRVTRIVQSLVNFSHGGQHDDPHESQPLSVHNNVQEAIELLSLNKDYHNIRLQNQCQPEHWVIGDAQKLQQVFVNLISNAKDACGEQGDVTISSQRQLNDIAISITDTGSGIDAEVQQKIFEPFFTTKETGKGTGLGLALVYSIIEEHSGHIQLTSPLDESSGSGTCFTIKLPAYSGSQNSKLAST